MLRAGAHLEAPNSFYAFANLSLGDELLKSYPEREELRAGVRRVVKETLSIDKLEDNAELRSDVERAMDTNDDDDKDGV